MENISFLYNTSGLTECKIIYDNKEFIGHTYCTEADMDFWSEKTGCFIAEVRARIKKLKYQRSQLITALSGLKNFQKTLNCCKDSNPDSFESKRLNKEIRIKQSEIDAYTATIEDEQNYLKEYIKNKDKFYQRMRAKRGQNT